MGDVDDDLESTFPASDPLPVGGAATSAEPGPVVAVTAEDDRFQAARQLGQRLASEAGQPLILYDWDAPSVLAEPLPTWWSSEGSDELFSERLDARQLDTAGRSPIARQVDAARSDGVQAFGWLPSDHGPGALADYARRQHASTIVVPADLREVDGIEAAINGTTHPAQAAAEVASAKVVVAPPDMDD
jgi:hypothetical protein